MADLWGLAGSQGGTQKHRREVWLGGTALTEEL